MNTSIAMLALSLSALALSYREYKDEQFGWATLLLGVAIVDCILALNF